VIAHGSEEVRRLLGLWEKHARKIQNVDQLIELLEQTHDTSTELYQEAHKEHTALPDYKKALFKAEDAIRAQMRRELGIED
jgi:hypothetical protein